jgi:hypothetical protein
MSVVFYLRPIDPPIEPNDVRTMAQHAGGCFDLHHVDWKQSFLATDGGRMLCWYGAPDAESARLALRQLGSDMNAVWTGEVAGNGPASPKLSQVEVVAEILFDAPLGDAEHERRIAALRQQGLIPVCRILSAGGTRLVLLFRAGDVRAIEAGLGEADFPAERVWACVPVTPFPDRQPGSPAR